MVLYLIYLLRKPIGWLLIATFLAIALSGPVNLLHRRMRRGFAISIVYLGLLMIPIGIGALIVPPITSFNVKKFINEFPLVSLSAGSVITSFYIVLSDSDFRASGRPAAAPR